MQRYIPNNLGLAGMFLTQSQGGVLPDGPTAPQAPAPAYNAGLLSDPFGSAMSGNQSGTLQPYINRQNQLGSNALYGGLLGYQPQPMMAGNAGGTPQNSQVPEGFSLPSAIPGGLLSQFGKRSWMQGS